MPALTFFSRSSRPAAPPPDEVHLLVPEGADWAENRFWAAACAAAAGLRLVVEELPGDGPSPSRGRLTLCAPQGETTGAGRGGVELWAGTGSGADPVRVAGLELPQERELLVRLLVERAGRGGAGIRVVLCHAGAGAGAGAGAVGRPGLAWSVARLLSAPGSGAAVDLGSGRADGLPEDAEVGGLVAERLARLLTTPAPGAVVVDVGADQDLAERLLGAATLGVMVGTGARAPDPPGPDWIGVRVRGRLGQGEGLADWARHLGRRSALELGARVELAADQRRTVPSTDDRNAPVLPSRRALRGVRS